MIKPNHILIYERFHMANYKLLFNIDTNVLNM